MRTRTLTVLTIAATVLAACSGSDDSSDTSAVAESSTSADEAPSTDDPSAGAVVAGEAFPEARCEANTEAGTITFLTGFDFAAAASIVDVIVADSQAYYEDLCLDVEVLAGFSSSNYPLVAAGNAQFASGGSFSEVVNFSAANDASFLATSVEGRSAIDTLIVKSGEAAELSDLAGTTIGVKGKLPTSIDVMLRQSGLVEGEDFDTVLLDGFDPLAHIEIPTIVGMPGWKSNEVGALTRAGVAFQLFDPLEYGVPGSFGVIFTSAEFAAEHPSAAQDFVRATMRGLADAIADPEAAATTAVDMITSNGNPNFLSPEGEVFRWETEANLILDGTPEGVGFGVPDPAALQAELDAYAEVGLFGDGVTPSAVDYLGLDLINGVYGPDAMVVWPG